MLSLANVAAASSAEPTSSPGMKRFTASLANFRFRNCSASHLLREARRRTARAMDMAVILFRRRGRRLLRLGLQRVGERFELRSCVGLVLQGAAEEARDFLHGGDDVWRGVAGIDLAGRGLFA